MVNNSLFITATPGYHYLLRSITLGKYIILPSSRRPCDWSCGLPNCIKCDTILVLYIGINDGNNNNGDDDNIRRNNNNNDNDDIIAANIDIDNSNNNSDKNDNNNTNYSNEK